MDPLEFPISTTYFFKHIVYQSTKKHILYLGFILIFRLQSQDPGGIILKNNLLWTKTAIGYFATIMLIIAYSAFL